MVAEWDVDTRCMRSPVLTSRQARPRRRAADPCRPRLPPSGSRSVCSLCRGCTPTACAHACVPAMRLRRVSKGVFARLSLCLASLSAGELLSEKGRQEHDGEMMAPRTLASDCVSWVAA